MWDSNLKTLAHKFQSARSNHHHVFPANENMKRKWVAAVQRKDFMPTKHSRICSKHFTEDCYDTEAFGIGRRLKPNVVPSLFEYSSCLRKKSGKRKASIKRVTSAKLAPTISDVCVSNLLAKVKYLHKKFIVVDKENMNLDAQAKDCSELFNCYESDNRDVLRDTCISEAAPQNLLHVSAPTSSKYQENKQTALIEEHHRNEPYENEKVSLEYMCRVCAEYSNRLIPLFEKGAEDVDVVTKIHTHLPIMVVSNLTVPGK